MGVVLWIGDRFFHHEVTKIGLEAGTGPLETNHVSSKLRVFVVNQAVVGPQNGVAIENKAVDGGPSRRRRKIVWPASLPYPAAKLALTVGVAPSSRGWPDQVGP